jgi:hypothetical protein
LLAGFALSTPIPGLLPPGRRVVRMLLHSKLIKKYGKPLSVYCLPSPFFPIHTNVSYIGTYTEDMQEAKFQYCCTLAVFVQNYFFHSARRMDDDDGIILFLLTSVAAAHQLIYSYYILFDDLPTVKKKNNNY